MPNIPITDEEKYKYAQHLTCIVHEKILFAEKRSSEVADQFTGLEVQIATILFAFIGFFSGSFQTMASSGKFSGSVTMLMKLTFSLAVLCLIISLIFGLVHMKKKEQFWDRFLDQRSKRFLKWDEVLRRTATFEQADAFYVGSSFTPNNGISFSPKWTWQLQTVFLSVAILLLFITFIVFLFN